MTNKAWLTAAEAAAIIGISVRYVQDLGRRGKLRRQRRKAPNGYKPFHYHAADVAAYAERTKTPPGYVPLAEAARRAGLSVATVRQRCADETLDCIKRPSPQGRQRWLVPAADLEKKPTRYQVEAQRLLDTLDVDEREQRILELRALGWPLEAIGDALRPPISRQRVGRIIRRLVYK